MSEVKKTYEAKKGIDIILLYRFLKNAKTEAAFKLAFQTEHSNEISRNADAQKTKDGNIQNLGAVEYEFSAKSIVAKGDKHIEELRNALIDGDSIEIWEIDKAEKNESNKYKATYYRGYVTKFGTNPNSEDSVELELEFSINGIGKTGYATLTDEQAKVVQYVFKDTTIDTTEE